MSCAVEAAGCWRGRWGIFGPCGEHGGVFENRIEDRKPLRVLFSVEGRWMEFREIFDQSIFSKPEGLG
jgi:hypothetical protein